MEIRWDGTTLPGTVTEDAAKCRSELANAAHAYDWSRVLDLLKEHPEFVNSSRPGGSSWFAPLHQAAHGAAPHDVIRQLLELGAWRTLQNARGERPVDVAERSGHHHLRDSLEPVYRHRIPLSVLLKIQSHFHDVIRGRASDLVKEHALRLPELEPLLELETPQVWFAVPGMYGGFSYGLESFGVQAKLVSESWSRIVGGSGQRHEITSEGSRLVEEGFV
jgi:hypothetical protein